MEDTLLTEIMVLREKNAELVEMLKKFLEKDLFDYEQGEPSESYFQYMNEAKKLINSNITE